MNNRATYVKLAWVEYIKAIALIWIFLNHFAEQIFGGPYLANPNANWPPLAERIAQFQPIQGNGILQDILYNILRYIGWTGDNGVQLFLIVSGFGLTWGLLARYGEGKLPLVPYYIRRASRIYPLWWGAHLLFFVLAFFTRQLSVDLSQTNFYLSLLGVRIFNRFYIAPAWWYIGLIIQLYLIYPILWAALRRWGPWRLLLIGSVLSFIIKAVGLLYFEGFLASWARGVIFITRLPEFLFGISLAAWFYHDRERIERWLRAPSTLLLGVVAFSVGVVLCLSLLGMTVGPFFAGVGAFILFYALVTWRKTADEQPAGRNPLLWIGRHTYSLFLMHHTAIILIGPSGWASPGRIAIGFVGAVIATVVGALFLERATGWVVARVTNWYRQRGLTAAVLRVVIAVGILLAVIVGGELLVRRFAPQEAFGWAERESLAADPVVGWHLKPSSSTHLRWLSYDYTVTANALGFPGPEYPEAKSADTFRILVTGDAFSSAEGVDTEQAWPRLLESDLAEQLPDQKVEVMNFAITGYGPNQFAAVVDHFAPLYKPDLILIQAFVNEYEDVARTTEGFQAAIGFDQVDGIPEILSLAHLRHFIRADVLPRLPGIEHPHRDSLSGIMYLERDQEEDIYSTQEEIQARLEEIQAVAEQIDAPVVVLLVPVSAQVCAPDELPYFPSYVDLTDTDEYDLDLPQRHIEAITSDLSLGYYDLRPALRAAPACPYQPYNLHWLPSGHQAVADFLAESLLADAYITASS